MSLSTRTISLLKRNRLPAALAPQNGRLENVQQARIDQWLSLMVVRLIEYDAAERGLS
jgi:hypothetical protein